MGTLLQDLRYGLRMLRKNPGFTAVAVITLALGIGANTAIFSFFSAALWRPLPVRDPHSVVKIFTTSLKGDQLSASSYPSYVDYRDQNRALSDLAAYSSVAVNLQVSEGAEQPERVYAQAVSPNFFRTLGLTPTRGRDFENTERASTEVILSWRLWERSFHSDPAVLGKTIAINNQVFTVIGVGPAGFAGLEASGHSDLFVPFAALPLLRPDSDWLTCRDCTWLNLVGRLRPGVNRKSAEAAMRTVSVQIEAAHPELNRKITLAVTPGTLEPRLSNKVLPVAVLLFVAVAVILLISCANVANLLLARAATRRREIGIRLAIGAGPARLIRQLLTESTLLALLAGVVSLLLMLWLQKLMPLLQTSNERPLNLDVSPDIRVFCFAFAISLCSAVVCGLAPALQLTHTELAPALRGERDVLLHRRARARLRGFLVVVQVALSLVLLISAGLLVRGLQRAAITHPGFETRNVLTAPLNLGDIGYRRENAVQVFTQIEERLAGLPGVRSAALARIVPLGHTFMWADVTRVGDQGRPSMLAAWNIVTPGYFQTLGIPLLIGRDFGREDRPGAPVAIVDQTMARRFWSSENPLGKRLKLGNKLLTVIGVATDTKYRSLGDPPTPQLYTPLSQSPSTDMNLLVHGDLSPLALLANLRRELMSIDKNLQLRDVRSLTDHVRDSLDDSKTGAKLAGLFGLLALLLATVGVYGVISFAVNQRTQEIGVRMALGATQRDTLTLVLRQGFRLSSVGVGLGIALAFAASRVLMRFLFGLSPVDPVTYASVALLLLSTALFASYIPARRATKVDPIAALRYE